MKKEKTVKTYQRRTKTGKIVTVKQHTAKYDAAEALKEAAKKKGAGDELESLKKKKPVEKVTEEELSDFMELLDQLPSLKGNEESRNLYIRDFKKAKGKEGRQAEIDNLKWEIKEEKKNKRVAKADAKFAASLKSERNYGFTADEYKAWYHWDQDADPKNAAAKKVEKALKAKMGAKGYKKYFDEMTDSYSSRGHNKAFKALEASSSKETKALEQRSKDIAKMVEGQKAQMKKAGIDPDKRLSGKKATEAKKDLISKGFTQKKDEYGDTYLMKGKDVYHYIPSGAVMGGAKLDKITGGKDYDKAKKLFGEKSVTSGKETKGSKESKAGKGPVGREYEGPATLQTYKGDLSKASVRKMEGGKGYHITSPEGYSLARFSTKAAADKALASRTFDDKHSAKVEEWKQNGNVRGLQKEIAKIKLQYGNDRKKAAKLIKPLEEAIAAAKSSSKKETKSKKSSSMKLARPVKGTQKSERPISGQESIKVRPLPKTDSSLSRMTGPLYFNVSGKSAAKVERDPKNRSKWNVSLGKTQQTFGSQKEVYAYLRKVRKANSQRAERTSSYEKADANISMD